MRTVLATFLGLGLAALIPTPASAQPPRGFSARMGTFHGLLGNESVQKELKLDNKQVEKARDLEEKGGEKMREKFQELGDLEPSERFAKMQEINREIGASTLKTAGEFLKPEQVDRLKQIAYQIRGANAFADPDLAKKLELTDAQKSDIKSIQQEAMHQRQEIFQEAQGDREAMMKKMAELNKETLAKVEGKLTKDQQKTWKGLLGSPFEIKFE